MFMVRSASESAIRLRDQQSASGVSLAAACRQAPARRLPSARLTIMDHSDHPELVPDAMEYVEEMNRELAAENTAPPPGVEGRIVSAILDDPELRDYVRNWAQRNHVLEAGLEPPERLPMDKIYPRLRGGGVAAEGGGAGAA